MTARRLISRALRRIADRVDPPDAPKATGLTMGYVERVGLVVEWNGAGARLWHLNDDDREQAWDPRVGGVRVPEAHR